MMSAGAMVALIPATAQAAAGRLFAVDGQASLSIALAVGAFASVTIAAWSLESRLADVRSITPTFIPRWSIVLGCLAGTLLALLPGSVVAVCISLPLVQVSLFLGRTHAVTVGGWKKELMSAFILFLGSAATFLLALNGSPCAMAPLGVSAVGAIITRAYGTWNLRPSPFHLRRALWVTAETMVVAATPLAINVTVLVLIGPHQSVAFRMILTVLGVLQPILGYTRIRLLSAHSTRLMVGTYVLSGLALATVLALDRIGFFGGLFGKPWSYVTLLSLSLACAWKLLTIPETVPFATMRRHGAVPTVFSARVVSTALFLALGVGSAWLLRSTDAVFSAFVVAQIATVLVYSGSARRVRAPASARRT